MEGAGGRPARLTAARGGVLADCKAVRNDLVTPGSMIPRETELGADIKVSRTMVPEALMLLEGDGLIRAHRGVERFISDTLPRIGIQRIRPFDKVLAGARQTLEVKPHQSMAPRTPTGRPAGTSRRMQTAAMAVRTRTTTKMDRKPRVSAMSPPTYPSTPPTPPLMAAMMPTDVPKTLACRFSLSTM